MTEQTITVAAERADTPPPCFVTFATDRATEIIPPVTVTGPVPFTEMPW